MSIKLNLKKGLDIKIEGAATTPVTSRCRADVSEVAITPDDFPGLTLKVDVREGDKVVKGQPVMHDKTSDPIKLVAPASGTVKAIVRGARRKIERVVISVDSGSEKSETFRLDNISDAESVKAFLFATGLWAMIRQRPYDIVPAPSSLPRDIFVTTFDSAPLAPDYTPILAQEKKLLETGVKALAALTPGKVYIGRRADSGLPDVDGAEMIDIKGPHPAGNAGVQIANVAPVNKGETVWALDGMTLLRVGHAITHGTLLSDAIVAVTGSEIKSPGYVTAIIGADIKSLIGGNLKETDRHQRIISGNVLTGFKESLDGFLRYPYRQVTVIPEGDDVDEFMGWASISPKKMSTSRSFPGHFLFKKAFRPDARLLGGHRAMIMSGEYDRMLPMDIMCEYLIKAILARDIDKMEALGIYEIAPEDVALAEYADTSKLELQRIVRDGLDFMRKEID